MLRFLSEKLAKFGCFFGIALLAIAAAATSKAVLKWFNYDDATSLALSERVGDYVGQGLLGALLIIGLIGLIQQFSAERKAKATSPPPLPTLIAQPIAGSAATIDTAPSDFSLALKKGCLVLFVFGAVVAVAGLCFIYYAASEYEKGPKQPGEGEVFAAENLIRSYQDREGFGNTPEAAEFALEYARSLRTSRQLLFTTQGPSTLSMSKGHFLTYCHVCDDSVAILVHIPDLRSFSEDAKVTLAEWAWMLATTRTAQQFPRAKKMAVGVKGVMNYAAIFTGEVNAQAPMKGIKSRHPTFGTKPLWPFFSSPADATAVKQKADESSKKAAASSVTKP